MTYVEVDVANLLTGRAGLTALVGDRVYPLHIPQGGTHPALVYQKISGTHLRSHSGQSGLGRPRVQITCWATSYQVAKEVIEQVRQAFAEGMPTAALTDLPDRYENDTELYGVAVDALVWHQE